MLLIRNTIGVLLVAGAVFLCGCDSPRQSIRGTVSLDGKALSKGYISFRPLPNTPGPTAGAEIVDGKYTVASAKGPFTGQFRVEITASRATGMRTEDELTGKAVESYEQFLPSKYNSASELTAEITDRGSNRVDFALESK